MISASQLRAIHALRRKIAHYDEADYRAMLDREYRVSSTKALTFAQAGKVIETLKTLAGDNGKLRRAGVTAEGPYAGKLRALWLSAYHLCVVRNRDDAALIAFVQRQTKITHTRFLTDAADATKAIEALKSWIARKAGVEWPERDESEGAIDTKRAVAKAACRLLLESGTMQREGLVFEQLWPSHFVEWCFKCRHVPVNGEAFYKPQDWDAMTAAAGRWMRVAASKAKSQKRRAA